jgi:predicted DCC family thiol-disulfide oxidoreductase YuxK
MKRILIIGGHGIFGGHLARLLANESALDILVAGRSIDKARAFCDKFPAQAKLTPQFFDRNGDVVAQLRTISPDIVVDASGPFQSYGTAPYRVIKACLDLGLNYLDLADSSDFVDGVAVFNDAAQRKKIFILSGVSSFPVLTAAVVRNLSASLARVETITGGIAPSPFAGVGQNVLRAIASYAGKPITLTRDGHLSTAYALTESLRYTICPPGRLPLRPIRFSLVDVPDLRVIPRLYPEMRSIWMGAGPVPEILHRLLNGLSWLVRLGILPSLGFLSGLFYEVMSRVRWGEHRGGMFVEVTGADADGRNVRRSWHLIAEGDDGPPIPSMACEGLIRACLKGAPPAPGARAATQDLELKDYVALFGRRSIYMGFRDDSEDTRHPFLYKRILGDAWQRLPPPIQHMHEINRDRVAQGIARIERGEGMLSKIAAAFFGFPPAGQNVPVTVEFQLRRGKEIWRRSFGAHRFYSTHDEGRDRTGRLVYETFGLFRFGLALVVEGDRLRFVVRQARFFGLPVPPFLLPRNNAYEYIENGMFHFYVELGHWLTGPIVTYRGKLAASIASASTARDNRDIRYSYASDRALAAFPDDAPVFIFDGTCVLCSSAAQWLLRHDKQSLYRYLPAQSALGKALYAHYGLDMDKTFLVIDNGYVYEKSAACFRIAASMGGVWRALAVLCVLPEAFCDAVYGLIARNRYKWFGRTAYCARLPVDIKDHLIEGGLP